MYTFLSSFVALCHSLSLALALCLMTSMLSIAGNVNYAAPQMEAQPMAENLCALTFDDGPAKTTSQLLDMLDTYGIKATFFVLGKNVLMHPDIVRRALNEGHEIASHTYSHPNLGKSSLHKKFQEISLTNYILRSYGIKVHLLRPPYGIKDAAVEEIVRRMDMKIVLWSRDSLDWKRLPDDYAKLPDYRGRIAKPGTLRGIFLFHDIHQRTVDALPKIVADLKNGGCQRFVTVSEFMNANAHFLDPQPPILLNKRNSAEEHELANEESPYTPRHELARKPWGGFKSDPLQVKRETF